MNNIDFFKKIKYSFAQANNGEEDVYLLVNKWGIYSYIIFFFVVDNIVKFNQIKLIDLLISSFAIVYFSWHIYALIKCKPTKPKISDEEKKKIRKEKIKNMPKSFLKKLFLQESIGKWNSVNVSIAADLYFITLFLSYIFEK